MESHPPEGEHPKTIRIQPTPYQTLPAYLNGQTSISRLWRDGEPERCQLCEACRASANNCLVVVPFIVDREDTPLFSTRGLRASNDRGVGRSEGYG